MPKVELSNGSSMIVPRALKRALEAVEIPLASNGARVSDADRKPALVVVAGDELVLVGPPSASRWQFSDIERVEADAIVTRSGTRVPITGWWYPGEAEQFRAAVRDRIGQEPPSGHEVRPAAPARVAKAAHVWFVGFAVFLIVASWIFAWVADAASSDLLTLALVISISSTCLLGVPLAICGGKLMSRSNRWMWLGVAGVLVGIAATILLVIAIVALISFASCSSNCI